MQIVALEEIAVIKVLIMKAAWIKSLAKNSSME